MTNAELIARLRDEYVAASRNEAADRIETLIAERDALFRRATLAEEWRDHDKIRAEEAEAKLAKAVEALENLLRAADTGWGFTTARNAARTALAEIKGENHE